MAFPPEVAAALSGASVRQLSYCRLAKSDEPLLAPEFHESRSRVSYSFRDVVALRAFVFLRSRRVSLRRVRKAVKSLRSLGETEHLSRYRLVAVGKDVVWRVSDEEAGALTGAPGQLVIAEMVDILAAFTNMWGRNVVPLCEPTPGVRVDPDIRGGVPRGRRHARPLRPCRQPARRRRGAGRRVGVLSLRRLRRRPRRCCLRPVRRRVPRASQSRLKVQTVRLLLDE